MMIFLIVKKWPELHNTFSPMICKQGEIKIRVYHPKYFAPNEDLRFRIVLKNLSSSGIRYIQVGILPAKDLWFQSTNIVTFRDVSPQSIHTGDITVKVPPFIKSNSHMEIRVFFQQETQSVVLCPQTFSLLNSRWHKIFILMGNAPLLADTLIRWLGYVVALLTAIVAILGKWQEIAKIPKWVKNNVSRF